MPIRRSDLNIPAVYSDWVAEKPSEPKRTVRLTGGPSPSTPVTPPAPTCTQQFTLMPTDDVAVGLAATSARMQSGGPPYLLHTITVLKETTINKLGLWLTPGSGKVLALLFKDEDLSYASKHEIALNDSRVLASVVMDAASINPSGVTWFPFQSALDLHPSHYQLLILDASVKGLHGAPLVGVQVIAKEIVLGGMPV